MNDPKVAPVEQRLRDCLENLVALVRGECPSLLNEDSGGDARLDIEIDELLAAAPTPEPTPVTDFNLYTSPPEKPEQSETERMTDGRLAKINALPLAPGSLVREVFDALKAERQRAEAAEAEVKRLRDLITETVERVEIITGERGEQV